MNRTSRFAVVGMALAALCCTAKYAQAPQAPQARKTPKAMQLRVTPAAFGTPRVHMAKSMPPQFTLALSREMPTPGWTFSVDEIEVDETSRRIIAKVTQTAPEGMTAQVLTPTWLNLDLGTIDPGRYFLELYVRDAAGAKHLPAHAVLLEAK
jgi:hypothetical protein